MNIFNRVFDLSARVQELELELVRKVRKVQTVKIINKSGNPLPSYATDGSACMDLMASVYTNIPPNGTCIVKTRLYMEIPHGYKIEIYSRSGLASRGITVANTPGQVDSDYRGEVGVILHNSTEEHFYINQGDRIAQMAIVPVTRCAWQEVEELTETDRAGGGFGSTGR